MPILVLMYLFVMKSSPKRENISNIWDIHIKYILPIFYIDYVYIKFWNIYKI